MTAPAAPEPRLCPLCHRPNHCGALAGPDGAARCWCHDVKVPAALLARVPATERDRACICRDCIEAFSRDASPARQESRENSRPAA